MKISIIGLGLIGGSLAKALRHIYGDDITINAYDTCQKSLDDAYHNHIIDFGFQHFAQELFPCDFMFLCSYVDQNISLLGQIKEQINDSCILSDVSSVKSEIHRHIEIHQLSNYFIGGHPMTGSEKKGYNNSSRAFFENTYYIVTPSANNQETQIDKITKLITDIGAIPLIMNEDDHDFSVAGISHFPHVIASLLVNTIRKEDEFNRMAQIAAGGFKDITRIASSSPEMWKTICFENKDNLLTFIEKFRNQLLEIEQILLEKNDESMRLMFQNAKDYRDSLIDTRITSESSYFIIHVDIPDVQGILASVVSLLASHNVSIKNIGIIHNREFEEGALQIEFYTKKEQLLSIKILEENNYRIFQ